MTVPDLECVIEVPFELDLARTLFPLTHGTGDPTIRVAAAGARLAHRTPAGPVAIELTAEGAGALRARAWGPGAEAGLAAVPALIGAEDEPAALVPHHALVADLQRRLRGVRLTRSGRPFDALLPAILEQKLTGFEARRSYRALIRVHGHPAPGPTGLWLAPEPAALAALPYHAFHPFGVERRRAETIRRAAALAPRLGATATPADARRLLASVPGIGPWTTAEVLRVAYGDPDALSVGDYHLPGRVAWAFAGERRADDARMLELLAPYVGQRGRIQRLIEASPIGPPRRGPRMAPRAIAAI